MMFQVSLVSLGGLHHWRDSVKNGKRDASRRRLGILAAKKLLKGMYLFWNLGSSLILL